MGVRRSLARGKSRATTPNPSSEEEGRTREPHQGDRDDRRPHHGQPHPRLRPRNGVRADHGRGHGRRCLRPRFPHPQLVPPAVRRGRVRGRLRALVQPAPERRGRDGGGAPVRRRGDGGVPADPDRDHGDFRGLHARLRLGARLGLAGRSGKVRAGGRAVADHLPLSHLHQLGVALLGRPQFADPLRRRGLRPGPAQHRLDRRPDPRPRRRPGDGAGDGGRGHRRRRAAARAVLGQRSAARPQDRAQAAAHDRRG